MSDERGTLSIVAITGALVLCLFALAAADLGAMVLWRARAQAAADAAALAAAMNQAPILRQGAEPEAAARAEAERNGATLLGCECEVSATSAAVEVVVRSKTTFIGAWSGRDVRARARAELDPDVLTYRDGD